MEASDREQVFAVDFDFDSHYRDLDPNSNFGADPQADDNPTVIPEFLSEADSQNTDEAEISVGIPQQPELDLQTSEADMRSMPNGLAEHLGSDTFDAEINFNADDETNNWPDDSYKLVEKIDQLVEEKFVPEQSEPATLIVTGDEHRPEFQTGSEASEEPPEQTIEGDDLTEVELDSENIFVLDHKAPGSRTARWLGIPVLLVLILLLAGGLGYQAWLRQALPLLENKDIQPILQATLAPLADPLEQQLQERLNLELPIRRDLKGLQLVSAQTDAHGTRSSTILLRVGLVNRSDISQPLPWLELTLTDENGRLVARRALNPQDYLYNNDTANRIEPHELKKFAIEMLSFPELAKGYELKLIDK